MVEEFGNCTLRFFGSLFYASTSTVLTKSTPFLCVFEVLNFSLLRHGLLTLQCLPSTHFYTRLPVTFPPEHKKLFCLQHANIPQLISVTEMSCGWFHCLDKIASTRQDVKQTDFAFYGRFNGFLLQPFCLIVKCAIVLLGILIAKSLPYSHITD